LAICLFLIVDFSLWRPWDERSDSTLPLGFRQQARAHRVANCLATPLSANAKAISPLASAFTQIIRCKNWGARPYLSKFESVGTLEFGNGGSQHLG
jgi:hypothetical protein